MKKLTDALLVKKYKRCGCEEFMLDNIWGVSCSVDKEERLIINKCSWFNHANITCLRCDEPYRSGNEKNNNN